MAAPSTPANLSIDTTGSNGFVLTWDNVAGETGFYLYRSTDNFVADSRRVLRTLVDVLKAWELGLLASTQYYYKISAFNGDGESSLSAAVNDTTSAKSLKKYWTGSVGPFPYDENALVKDGSGVDTVYGLKSSGQMLVEEIPLFDKHIVRRIDVFGGGSINSPTIEDADQDTKVQCEESGDEDIIRFDAGVAGQVAQMDATGLTLENGTNINEFSIDEALAGDSDNVVPTEQAVKAYADTKMADLVEDTTPQLGGDLDLNGKNIDFPTTPDISDCLDEDNMVSDSPTMLATQQSIKAYVDTHEADTTSIHGIVDTSKLNTSDAVIVDHRLVRGDGGAQKIQDSGIIIDDSDNITVPGWINIMKEDLRIHHDNADLDGIIWKNTTYTKMAAGIKPIDLANWGRCGLGIYTGDNPDSTTDAQLRVSILRNGNVEIDKTLTIGDELILSSETVNTTSEGVAASITKQTSFLVTDGDQDLNQATLVDGVTGMEKIFLVKTLTDPSDTVKVTPDNLNGGTQITFDAAGQGCIMMFDGTNWNIVSNNGGVIA